MTIIFLSTKWLKKKLEIFKKSSTLISYVSLKNLLIISPNKLLNLSQNLS